MQEFYPASNDVNSSYSVREDAPTSTQHCALRQIPIYLKTRLKNSTLGFFKGAVYLSSQNDVHNRKIVENASAYREQVPYRVKVAYAFLDVEKYAHKVKCTAYAEVDYASCGHSLYHRLKYQKYRKPHYYVADKRGLFEPFKVNGIKHYPQYRDAPDDTEDHPAQRPTQRHKGYRRVCSRYEKEDRVVIHYPEKAFSRGVGNCVVQGGHSVEYYKRCAENSRAYNAPRI